MVKLADEPPANFAELHERLGWVPLHRIRTDPPPGTATEADLLRVERQGDGRTYELIDGTLVSKAMGATESLLAQEIGRLLGNFVAAADLGVVLGPDGGLRLFRGNVRYPDVTFISWEDIGADETPPQAFWSLPPTLAVKVLSPTNTAAEIERKLTEFFRSGCKMVWVIDRATQSATSYTSPTRSKMIGPGDKLDGGKVLSGFKLPLAELFAATKRRKKGKSK